MLRSGTAVDQNIIQVSGAEDVQIWSQGIINKPLKGHGGSGKPKRHNQRLKQAEGGVEGSQVFFSLTDPQVIKSSNNINAAIT